MRKGSPETTEEELVMQFDPNTIQHLGIKMYSTLPPVIAEIIANSYDADAKEVNIYLNDTSDLEIIIEDDGHGMGYSELNPKFLKIGRNRREEEEGGMLSPGLRPVIGKKGIGKLSFFGIAKLIIIETIKGHLLNAFSMSLDDIQKERNIYKPKIIHKNKKVGKQCGTTVKLHDLKRKSKFSPSDIARSLARAFSVFDEDDFNVKIIHNDKETIELTNDMKYEGIPIEFEWQLPMTDKELVAKLPEYKYSSQITGKIISSEHTVPADMKGVALFSNGKLVNDHSFYGNKATSHGYEYLTGDLDVSFIDKWDEDVISTNRRSLNWENEETRNLETYLRVVITQIYNKQRELRKEKKKARIVKIVGADIDAWVSELPKHEQKLARNMVNVILDSEELDDEKSGNLITYVQDSFQFESFKEFAAELDAIAGISEENLIKLLKDWELIEAKEFYKLSLVRIEAIKTFEKHIAENALEVPTVHNFLKTFPWLLEPRIMEFEDEVYYSKLLKQKFPDTDEELESNKRIDFLCTSLADNRFIIELKRPQHKIRKKDILQADEYRTFVESLQGNEPTSARMVVAYVVCGERNDDRAVRSLEDSMWGKVYIRTYHELLTRAQKYHKEFIEKYDKLIELKSKRSED